MRRVLGYIVLYSVIFGDLDPFDICPPRAKALHKRAIFFVESHAIIVACK